MSNVVDVISLRKVRLSIFAWAALTVVNVELTSVPGHLALLRFSPCPLTRQSVLGLGFGVMVLIPEMDHRTGGEAHSQIGCLRFTMCEGTS